MNRLRIALLLAAAMLSVSAPRQASAQRLTGEGDITTYFDNREYTGSQCGVSQTIFHTRLNARVGVKWQQYNSIIAGVSLEKQMGDGKFLSRALPIAYYALDYKGFSMRAGIFERNDLKGDYSSAFFSDSVRVKAHTIQGLGFRYKNHRAHAELVLDWEGMYSERSREKFRIITSAGYAFRGGVYIGNAFTMFHFADSRLTQHNVVDNMLLNPYAGIKFNAFFDFDLRLGYVQSFQHDRIADSHWVFPKGGEFTFTMSRWGVVLRNNFYYGQNQMPFFDKYGSELYAGNRFYSTRHRIYDRASIAYERWFFRDTLGVKAEFVFHHDGRKLLTQQIIAITARIGGTLYDKANHNKRN